MSTIDKPDHYAPIGGVYPIDISERLPHCLGAALEYLWRAGRKAGQPAGQDYRKAAWYLRRLVEDTKAPWFHDVTDCIRVDPLAKVMATKARRDERGDVDVPLGPLLTLIASEWIPVSAMTSLAEKCEQLAAAAESRQ